MPTIAILDERSRLVGFRELLEGEEGLEGVVQVVDDCDLPVDGSYKWMSKNNCFMPGGHGLGKPGPSPVSTEKVVAILAANMDNPPQELVDWLKWHKGLREI